MKKITTSGRSFGTAQSLTRQQLKNVMGGTEGEAGKCGATCSGACTTSAGYSGNCYISPVNGNCYCTAVG